jgi:PEP-CTERM/exosortase A-associated glycosyltransferase
MRVLHVLDHSIPLHSGYTFRTLAILREQRRLGWQTLQLTTPKQGATTAREESADSLVLHRTPNRGDEGLVTQMRMTARRIGELVRSEQPDIWSRMGSRVPLVYELRASWEDAAVDHGTTTEGSLRYRLSRGLETIALMGADQITTICDGLRGDIESRGIAADKVTVIPNAVDVADFRFGVPASPELQARLGLAGRTVLGFAGSFYGYEGLHLLVQALALLRRQRPDLMLLLVGGGPQEQSLRAQVAAAGLGDAVVFTGRVPHTEVQRYYEVIDVLVYPRLPIRLTELVTPLKPLEAMAQGRVFVASDVGGHRELIRHGDTGYLCPAGSAEALAQALDAALNDRFRWPAMRERARRFVERERTWANSVSRYAEVYRRALVRRGRPVPAALQA